MELISIRLRNRRNLRRNTFSSAMISKQTEIRFQILSFLKTWISQTLTNEAMYDILQMKDISCTNLIFIVRICFRCAILHNEH